MRNVENRRRCCVGKRPLPTAGRLVAVCLGFFLAVCVTENSLTKKRIREVEKGLLRAVTLKGQKQEKLSLQVRMRFYNVPAASVAVMDRNEIEWAKAYGVREFQNSGPVTTETVFRAGEIGQPLLAAAAMRLAEEGRLALDEVHRFEPEDASDTAREKITIRGLLTHSSGDPLRPFPASLDPGWERHFMTLRRILENVAAEPFASLVQARVLTPLAMNHSTFDVPLPPAMAASMALGHSREGSPVEVTSSAPPSPGASSFWTTPSDLLRFAAGIMKTARGDAEGIVSAESARAMLTRQVGNRSLGFMVEGSGQEVRIALRGRSPGFSAVLVVYPYRSQGAVIMTNSDNGLFLSDEVLRAVSAAYGWPDFMPEERTLYRLDPSIYRQYAGRYEITEDYHLEISYEDYYLIVRPTGQVPTKFYVESPTFFFSIDPFIRIQFHSDERGVVTGLVLWQQNFEQEAKKIG